MTSSVPDMRAKNVQTLSVGASSRAGRSVPHMSRSPSLTRSVPSSKTLRSRSPAHTLEKNVIPDHQWWPTKEKIIVDQRFFSEDDTVNDQPIDRLSIQSAERLRQAILDIDEEGSAAHRWLPGVWRTGVFAAGFATFSSLVMDSWSQALADEGADKTSGFFGISGAEAGILLAPALLYLGFIVYRTSFNPKAKPQDFLFLVAGFFVVANISSIVFLRTRLF